MYIIYMYNMYNYSQKHTFYYQKPLLPILLFCELIATNTTWGKERTQLNLSVRYLGKKVLHKLFKRHSVRLLKLRKIILTKYFDFKN